MLCKAQKYMNAEDSMVAKELKGKRKRDEGTNSNRDKKKETQRGGQITGKKRGFQIGNLSSPTLLL